MVKFISTVTSIGLERTPTGIKSALAVGRVISLSTFQPEGDHVKRLYIHHPVITTGLEGKETLIRPLHLPLVKEKDIGEAVTFQAEPLLPYAADQAYLAYQVLSKTTDSTALTLLAVRKEAVQTHLDLWHALQIEPEKIACVPSALCEFGSAYFSSEKTFLILHVHHQEMICVLIKEGKLWASFAHSEGFNLLLEAQAKDGLASLPQSESEWQLVEQQKETLPTLADALKRLQKEATKMGYALAKECKPGSIEGILITGEAAEWEGLSQLLMRNLNIPLLICPPVGQHSSRDLHTYAVPIGLSLGSLPGRGQSIDFRQQEAAYPHPWRRLKIPVALYFVAVLLLSVSFYFFGQQYLRFQETQMKQNYIDLLASINKSQEDFEKVFVAKNPKAHAPFNGEIPKVEQLGKEDFSQRLTFLEKELQATPDSFPLFANTPRVSDVLAWLSQHPAVVSIDENGNRVAKLQIENFNFAMLKRPQQGKKQEKYQVKIELELTSPTPKWAREFHDALIAPNDWVDPKGEIKWNSNRGNKYKTSFFLKDKTVYPSS